MTTEPLKRVRGTGAAKTRRPARRAQEKPPAPPTDADVEVPANMEAYRRRMSAIGQTLSAMVVGMEPADSDLWGRGMYLKLVGKLYDALDSEDLTLEDLQALSKMISEQRRVQTQAREVERRMNAGRRSGGDGDGGSDGDEGGRPETRELPPQFGDMVKQIYGVNLHRGSRE